MDQVLQLHKLLQAIASGAVLQDNSEASDLLDTSKTSVGREQLLQSNAAAGIPSAWRALAQHITSGAEPVSALQPSLLWLSQLTRNLCAGNAVFCESILHSNALQTVLSLWDALLRSETEDDQLLKVVSQLVFNLAASSSACLACIWSLCFPRQLTRAVKLRKETVNGPVSILLLTACQGSPARSKSLFGPEGAEIITTLLHNLPQSATGSQTTDTIGLLLHQIAYQQGLLSSLLTSMSARLSKLATASNSASKPVQISVPESLPGVSLAVHWEEVTALQLLAEELESADPDRCTDANNFPQAGVWQSLRCLLHWAHTTCSGGAQQSTACQALEASLQAAVVPGMQALRAATSQDLPTSTRDHEQNALFQAMLVTILAMLSALAPIQPPSRSQTPSQHSTQSPNASLSTASIPAQQAHAATAEPMALASAQSDSSQGELQSQAHEVADSRDLTHLGRPTLEQHPGNSGGPTLLSKAEARGAQLQPQSVQRLHLSSSSGRSDPAAVKGHESAAVASNQLAADLSRPQLGTATQMPACNPSQATQSASPQPEQEASPASVSVNEQTPATAQQQDADSAVSHFTEYQTADTPSQLAEVAKQYPRQSLYKGYRVDLVALLANLSYRNAAVQLKVQQLGGVELILSQCQWDDENPLVREYGLWAVRNLCEGNEDIQSSISSLRACSTVDSPELQAKGLQIELDGKTGKPRLVANLKT